MKRGTGAFPYLTKIQGKNPHTVRDPSGEQSSPEVRARSSSESEQEHHDPRELRAPTAEQITVAAEQVRPAHGAHGSGTACNDSAAYSEELTEQGVILYHKKQKKQVEKAGNF